MKLPTLSLVSGRIVPFGSDIELSLGGQVLYLETKDPVLILRSAGEVNNAFPDLPSPFTPKYLFIVTWLQVPYANDGLVS